MSSFQSALSLPKVRGIPPIKIRIFDYGRWSLPFSIALLLFLPFSGFSPTVLPFDFTNVFCEKVAMEFKKITIAYLRYDHRLPNRANLTINMSLVVT